MKSEPRAVGERRVAISNMAVRAIEQATLSDASRRSHRAAAGRACCPNGLPRPCAGGAKIFTRRNHDKKMAPPPGLPRRSARFSRLAARTHIMVHIGSGRSWLHRHEAGGGREFLINAALVKNLCPAGASPAEALCRFMDLGNTPEGRGAPA